jgi:(+)-trans-carveol dehydrogenase
MLLNPATYRLFCPDIAEPTIDDTRERLASGNPMGIAWLESADIANAALWLASDEARYVTGTVIPLDAGLVNA